MRLTESQKKLFKTLTYKIKAHTDDHVFSLLCMKQKVFYAAQTVEDTTRKRNRNICAKKMDANK